MNRNVIVATAAALLLGVFAGVVLGQSQGGAGWLRIGGGGAEQIRSANAPRVGAIKPGEMAFDRLRIDTAGDQPVACLEFTKPLAQGKVNFADFIRFDPEAQVRFEANDNSLCLRGLPYDVDRKVTVLQGLPSADGKATRVDETFNLSFGDRPSFVGFAGNGVVLPRAEADGVGIETVNVEKLKVQVLRVSDRILSQHTIDEGQAIAEGSYDSWTVDGEASDIGVSIFDGEIDVAGTKRANPKARPVLPSDQRNRTLTTVFPLGNVLKDKDPGAYVIKVYDASASAGSRGETDRPSSAVRWIMYTDMALQTFTGATGLDVVVRSLKTARPESGVTLTLIAQNNDELARVRTNGEGRARFAEALMKGEGAHAARYVMAYGGKGDFAALDLQRGTLDLSDRDVDGRTIPGDVDAFMFTERGIYRPGEVVRVNGMLRDPSGRAITNRQSTLVVYRPNGTEFARKRLLEAKEAGAILKNIAIDKSAPRGGWRATLLVDGQDAPAGEVSFQVEDFVPQRLKVKIDGVQTPLGRGQTRPITVDAQFLYGAPGSGLKVEGEGRLQEEPTPFPEFKGYTWGVADESFSERYFEIPGSVTDGAGRAQLDVAITDAPDTTLPLRAKVVASVEEPGGRVVREHFDIPVRLRDQYIGVKPKNDGWLKAGDPASFDVVAVGADGQRVASRVDYKIVREDWNYDWYLESGQWKWRRTGRDINVAGAQGTLNVSGGGQPSTFVQKDLQEGSYRLILKNDATGAQTTYRFGVGWGGGVRDTDTPDMVAVVPPSQPVKAGGSFEIDVRPPYAGEAQIVVATDRVLSMRTESIPAGGKKIRLRADGDWGAGAYVLVTVMTPRDPAGRSATPVVPRRGVGVAYVPVDVGARKLQVAVGKGLPQVLRPNTRVDVPLQISNAPRGEKVRVVLAAVDEGILQLTDYKTPDPQDHYFGRRALGVGIRDDYGRLLNPNLGAAATPRQGGDSLGGEGLTVVPTKTVALWSGIVQLDGSGRGKVPLDLPDFNGSLRLVAVAWSETALGSAGQDVTVRDQVVADLTLPRFLAPGDNAFGTLRVDNIEGPSGTYAVTLSGSGAVQGSSAPISVTVDRGQNQTVRIPISAPALGIGKLDMTIAGPGGFKLTHSYDIESRTPYLAFTDTTLASQPVGATFSLGQDVFAGVRPGDAYALVSYSQFAGLDPAPLLDALDRYPYGCTEQLTSIAMPLLYVNTLAPEASRKVDRQLSPRVQDAITKILDRQSSDGAFGLWHAGDGAASPWLGAYATDFLTRAKRAGYAVPDAAIEDAYKGLKAVARLDDFQSVSYDFEVYKYPGQQDSKELLRSRAAAYALYVLAKAGKADIGQVRYYHDARLAKEPSPLARAQIGAALAYLGDKSRSRNAFKLAESALGYTNEGDWYQSPTRDTAGVLALAAEAAAVDPEFNGLVTRLVRKIEVIRPNVDGLMTQEEAQLLLAANALMQASGPIQISVNGQAAGPLAKLKATPASQLPILLANKGQAAAWRTLSVTGSPLVPPPPASNGLAIGKRIFRLNGSLADLGSIAQGDRLVVVLSGSGAGPRVHPAAITDLLPAGLEIESILSSTDGVTQTYDNRRIEGPFAWVGKINDARIAEKRDDRFVAAIDVDQGNYTLAYVARAVTPGTYALPGGVIEDMYHPGIYGRTEQGAITISGR